MEDDRRADAVLDDVREWQSRPLEDVYPIVFLDGLIVKVRDGGAVRNKACYLAIGVNLQGERDVLGLWFQQAEGAKFWLAVLNELKQRGVRDVLICCVNFELRRANEILKSASVFAHGTDPSCLMSVACWSASDVASVEASLRQGPPRAVSRTPNVVDLQRCWDCDRTNRTPQRPSISSGGSCA
jgi:hypothetical protein